MHGFFRNLLLGEQWELRSRYLHIHPTEEWKEQPNRATPTSTGQVQDKYRTSAGQERNLIETDSVDVARLVRVIGGSQLSVKAMMEGLELKGRDNFLNLYLNPAIQQGFVTMLYPDKPRHPRQKYVLTVKGLALYASCQK